MGKLAAALWQRFGQMKLKELARAQLNEMRQKAGETWSLFVCRTVHTKPREERQ